MILLIFLKKVYHAMVDEGSVKFNKALQIM